MVSAYNQTHDLDVQYSTINHDNLIGCNEKPKVQMAENNGKTKAHYQLYTF